MKASSSPKPSVGAFIWVAMTATSGGLGVMLASLASLGSNEQGFTFEWNLWVFIAFLIGASLLGIIGAILAIPVAAIVQVAFDEAFVKRRERRQDLDRAGTLLRKAD